MISDNWDIVDASFRGVRIDIINTNDEAQRELAIYEYPFVDGADVTDLGRKPRQAKIVAIFWGETYQSKLQRFIQVLDKSGSGELIHPVFGSMPNMQMQSYSIEHGIEHVNYSKVTVTFIESTPGNPFFTTEHPTQQIDEIFNKIDSLFDEIQNLFDELMKPINTLLRYAKRAKAVLSTALNMVASFRGEIVGAIRAVQDYIKYPSLWIKDMRATLSFSTGNKRSSRSAPSPALILSAWGEDKKRLNDLKKAPEKLITGEIEPPVATIPAGTSREDIHDIIAVTSVISALTLAQSALDIFTNEIEQPTLSPGDIELIANDVRQQLLDTIEQQRLLYSPATQQVSSTAEKTGIIWQETVIGLKTVALSVQDVAIKLIESRPPLLKRTVECHCNLHLLAHLWYNDYTRAAELHRLNPQLRHSNFISPGTVLNAYAK